MAQPNPAVQHQAFQGVPNLDYPLVTQEGLVNAAWYRFFIYLLKNIGGGFIPQTSSLQLTSADGGVTVVNNQNQVIGQLIVPGQVGGPEQILSPTVSPFIYAPTTTGTLLVNKAQLEYKRNANYHVVSVQGGSIFMLNGDSARITWFGSSLPEVVWFPII